MDTRDWWNTFNKNIVNLRKLVEVYHPTSEPVKHTDLHISTAGAEAAGEVVRNVIRSNAKQSGLEIFDAAAKSKDAPKLIRILNEAWFGLPESMSSHSLPGFGSLCDLCEGIDDLPDCEVEHSLD